MDARGTRWEYKWSDWEKKPGGQGGGVLACFGPGETIMLSHHMEFVNRPVAIVDDHWQVQVENEYGVIELPKVFKIEQWRSTGRKRQFDGAIIYEKVGVYNGRT